MSDEEERLDAVRARPIVIPDGVIASRVDQGPLVFDINADADVGERKEEEASISDLDNEDDDERQELDLTPPDIKFSRLWNRHRALVRRGSREASTRCLVRCLALARILHGDRHWQLGRVHAELADNYFSVRGMESQAAKHGKLAIDIAREAYHDAEDAKHLFDVTSVLVLGYFVLGQALRSQAQESRAEDALLKAYKFVKELRFKSDYPAEQMKQSVRILVTLALCCLQLKKHDSCQRYLDEALQLGLKLYGEDSVELIEIYQALGKSKQAESAGAGIDDLTTAYSIALEKCGDCSEEVASTTHSLAIAFTSLGDDAGTKAAERYLIESLGAYKRLHGARHAKTIAAQEELCRLLLRTDQHQKAAEQLASIIEAKKVKYGDPSEELASTYKLSATLSLSKGQLDKAVQHYEKCHAMMKTVLGANHKKTVQIAETINMLSKSTAANSVFGKSKLEQRPRFKTVVK